MGKVCVLSDYLIVSTDLTFSHHLYCDFVHKDFQIGDFFKEVSTSDTDNYYYRILGAFQALKSFVGKWYSDRTCIQKRGQ